MAPFSLYAQTTINGELVFTGSVDMSGTTSTLPYRTGAGSPVGRDSCVKPGEVYFQSDATTGQNIWACTAPGTPGSWTQVGTVLTGASSPSGACTAGALYSRTDVRQFYVCSAANAWQLASYLTDLGANRPTNCVGGQLFLATDTGALAFCAMPGNPGTWQNVTSAVSTVFGRTGAITAQSGDYAAAQVTNAVDATQEYSDPAWISTLSWSKLTSVPNFEIMSNKNSANGYAGLNSSSQLFPSELPPPGPATLGAVNSTDCSSGGQFIQKINTDGSETCSAPAAQVNSDWSATSGPSEILNKPPITTASGTDTLLIGTTATSANLGASLLTNGNFATGDCTGWTCGAGWAVVGNALQHATGSTAAISQSVSVVSGTMYQIDYSATGATAGTLTLSIGTASIVSDYARQSTAVVAGGTGWLVFAITPSTDYNGSLTNILLRSVTQSMAEPTFTNSDATPYIDFRPGWSGLNNYFGGLNVGGYDTSGYNNTAVGANALRFNTTGYMNTALGQQALQGNINGFYNPAVGHQALMSNTTGYYNVALGYQALELNTTGNSNTAVGTNSLTFATSGSGNTGLGLDALYKTTTGANNTAGGVFALRQNLTGNANTAFGYYALNLNTASNNTAIGMNTLTANTSGTGNTATGYEALLTNQTGNQSSGFGMFALLNNTSNNNTGIGYSALLGVTSGYENTAIGSGAGYLNGASRTTTGHDNTFVGYQASNASATQHNFMTVVGSGATGECDNCIVLGRSSDAPIAPGAVLTPSNSTAACTPGQFAFDASYIYTCVATNTWRRAATASW